MRTSAELRQRLKRADGTPTLLVFATKRCRACRVLVPKLERIAKQRGVHLLTVYHDSVTDAAFVEHEVSETPTTCVYDGSGTQVSHQVYMADELPQLEELLTMLTQGTSVSFDI